MPDEDSLSFFSRRFICSFPFELAHMFLSFGKLIFG